MHGVAVFALGQGMVRGATLAINDVNASADAKALGTLVENICYKNAAGFFDLQTAKF